MLRKIFAALAVAVALSAAAPALAAANPDAVQSVWAPQLLFDTAGYEVARTPVVYKTVSATVITSETTVWTPASGKRFRLMGFCITQGVAAGAITLKDNTAGTTILIIPQNTLAQALCQPLGNGLLSAAANNVLTATGASTETITGYFYGTEE